MRVPIARFVLLLAFVVGCGGGASPRDGDASDAVIEVPADVPPVGDADVATDLPADAPPVGDADVTADLAADVPPVGDADAPTDLAADVPPIEDADVTTDAPFNDANLDADQTPDGTPPDACAPVPECDVTFTYRNPTALSVKLHGDFRLGGFREGIAMSRVGDTFQASVRLQDGLVVQYLFEVDGERVTDPANPDARTGPLGERSVRSVDCGSCPRPDFDWRDAIAYRIVTDRFANGNKLNDEVNATVELPVRFQGGDLAGVLARVKDGYFRRLGVNVLLLTSPVDAPATTALREDGHLSEGWEGLWPSDLEKIEEHQGRLEDLRALVQAAHQAGLQVVFEHQVNHVHQDSPVVQDHPDWFWPKFREGKQCVCGDVCDWHGDALYCWLKSYLPDFDFTNPAARAYSVENTVEWLMESGADGCLLHWWRFVDPQWLVTFRARLADGVRTAGRFVVLGDIFGPDADFIGPFVNPEGTAPVDGAIDYPLRAHLVPMLLARQGSLQDLASFTQDNDTAYADGALMLRALGTEMTPRGIHFAQDEPLYTNGWDQGSTRAWDAPPKLPTNRPAFERMALGFAVLMTSPGVPLILQGDEIGVAGAGNPDNLRAMTWTGTTTDQDWLRERVSRLARIRRTHAALRRGVREFLGATAETWAYGMKQADGEDEVIVVLNRGDAPAAIPAPVPSGTWHNLIDDATVVTPGNVPPRSVLILLRK